MVARRFNFAFAALYRLPAAVCGIFPATAYVTLDQTFFTARFGPWLVRTSRANVLDATATGPFSVVKTIGPAHLSLVDRGLTMASNPERGVCLRFIEPVTGMEPTGRLRHPGLTVTVADCDGLIAALQ